VDGAWDAEGITWVLMTTDPVEKEGERIFVGGYLVPGYLLCLALDLGSSHCQRLLFLYQDSAMRHKPTEKPSNTTDKKSAFISAGHSSPAA
jgi:hypothetical protein